MPSLQVDTLANGAFTLAEDAPQHFTLVVFYRGLHCPICQKYVLELGRLQPEFDKRGVKVLLVSGDGREHAQAFAEKLNAPALRVGYGEVHRRHKFVKVGRANGIVCTAP